MGPSQRGCVLSLLSVIFCFAYGCIVVSIVSCIRLQDPCITTGFFKGNCTFDCYFCSNHLESILFKSEENGTYLYTCWWECRKELENITTECYLDKLYLPTNMYLPEYDNEDKKFFEYCVPESQKYFCFTLPLTISGLIISVILIVLIYNNIIICKRSGETQKLIN